MKTDFLDAKTVSQGFKTNKGATFYSKYYNNLFANGGNGSKGYPQNLRKIAIVNGSLTGSKKHSAAQRLSIDAASYGGDGEQVLNIRGFIGLLFNTHVASIETYFMPSPGKTSNIARYYGTKDKVNYRGVTGKITNRNSRGNMDNIPGGWFPGQKELRDETFKNDIRGINFSTRMFKPVNSFIPTFSAIAHTKPDQDWSKPLDYNLVCKGDTPFDTYYGTEINTQHTSFTEESVKWLLAELAGNEQEPYFPVNPKSLTSDTHICENTTKTYNFQSCNIPGAVSKWETSSNLQKTSSGATSITVKTLAGESNAGSITVTFKNDVVVKKDFWIGKTKFKTRILGSCFEPRYELKPDPLDKVIEWKIVHNGRTTYRTGSIINLEPHEFDLDPGKATTLRVSARNNCGWSIPKSVFIRKPTLCDCGYDNPNCGGSDGPPTPLITTEDDDTKRFYLYPNPTIDELFISLKNNSSNTDQIISKSGELKYEIYDFFSKVVRAGNTQIDSGIDVSGLIKGIYILKIISEKSSENHSIIIGK